MDTQVAEGQRLVSISFAEDVEREWSRALRLAREAAATQRVLLCRCATIPALDAFLDQVVSALADAALADWPAWYGADSESVRPEQTMLERRLSRDEMVARIANQHPLVSTVWLRRAIERCQAGASPFESSLPREIQASQIAKAISTGTLLIVLGVEATTAPDRAGTLLAVAEWLSRTTAARTAIIVPRHWQDQSTLNRAMIDPVMAFLPPLLSNDAGSATQPGLSVQISPLPGRPHPNSPAEQTLYRRIQADPELAGLLEFNRSVVVELGQIYRVDILCRDRRIVVEVDGDDHVLSLAKYLDDCERDYRLMKHGYLVLRLPNALIHHDPELAIIRIRDLLSLRQDQTPKEH